jgi:hypothetical protein
MSDPIRLPADELARLVVDAAASADAEGFWSGSGSAAQDALQHLGRFLGLLLAGDDELHAAELSLFGRVFEAVSGDVPSDQVLRATAMTSVEMASDPDALYAFLQETPAYLEAVVAMDRERGTHNAEQVVTSLGGLALAMLAADGREAAEEDAILYESTRVRRYEVPRYAGGAAGRSPRGAPSRARKTRPPSPKTTGGGLNGEAVGAVAVA